MKMPTRLHKLFRPLLMPAAAVAVAAVTALALSACGSGMNGEQSEREMEEATAHAPVQLAPNDPHAFAWLHPAPAPHAWRSSELPNGAARMAYPPAWKPIRTDPGTVTSALRDSDGDIRGYLNATPQQGSETLANWAGFRPDHNADEGDVDLRPMAAARNLRFRSGHGSCLLEDYRTSSDHPYREIACIVAGARATTVIVGAAPPDEWPQQGPAIERAISTFLT
jgi:hypothetical protein